MSDLDSLLQPATDFLEQLLTIVGHPIEEQAEKIEILLGTISQVMAATLVASLDESDRPDFLAKLSDLTDPAAIWKVFLEEFSLEEVQSALTFASQETLAFYLQQVGPQLSAEQQQQIDRLMSDTRKDLKEQHGAS